MRFLITGGCGFLGSNLAAEVIRRGEELCIFDNLSRVGSTRNHAWMQSLGQFLFVHGDIRNPWDVERAILDFHPDVIFHLAGQVAMTTSLSNPRMDFEVNALGTLNVLECLRKHTRETVVVYSSTNKVYGDLEWARYEESETRFIAPEYPNGFDERTPLGFCSPYGCSKGAADQYMLDYACMYGLRTVVFRHSSMYGGRQFSTYDQGWIGWFCQQAIKTRKGSLKEPFTISGTGKQVRDVLYVDDMTKLYFKAVANISKAKGQVFNIGGGVENSLSLLELFDVLERELGVKLSYIKLPWRTSDQKVFVSDISKAKNLIDWKPQVEKKRGIKSMLSWLEAYLELKETDKIK